MELLNRRTVLKAAAAAGVLLPGLARAASSGTEVFTSDEAGLLVDSTVILGETSAVVIDAQFTAGSAAALADLIASTGRSVETILITHYHPDHVLGLPILLDRFPGSRAVAHKDVQAMIARTVQPIWDRIAANSPAGVFADRAVIPEALEADHLLLDGARIDILGPMHGDTDLITPVHIPSLDTLITSDVAYVDTHLWLEENTSPERTALWRASIDALEAIGAGTIIPGHRQASSPNDTSAFAATRAYLDRWDKALAETTSAAELKAALLAGTEGLGFALAVDRSVAAIYPG